MQTAEALNHRGPDRRRARRFVVRERRTGFERRSRRRPAPAAALEAMLVYLRDNPATVAALLIFANVLSLADLALTHISLGLGAAEANPFMRYFLDASPAQAAFVKIGLVVVVSLVIWRFRRLRKGLELAVFLVALYGLIVLYELVGIGHLL